MKLKIGDNVCHPKYGSGEIVAMSKEWCVYFSDLYQCEIALHWNEVSIPIEPDVLSEGIQEIDIGQGEEESEDTGQPPHPSLTAMGGACGLHG